MSAVSATSRQPNGWVRTIASRAQVEAPALADWAAAVATSILLILSFPNFEFAALAWIGLVPLLVVIARRPNPVRALILGWSAGTIFFYGSCYWLTYSMVHYGGLPTIVAYLLLIPGAIVVGLFPGLFALVLAVVIRRWGSAALLFSPVVWVTFEYARLGVTGQLWNAIGYSQAFHPSLIRTAEFGAVYAVGFVIVLVNATIALLLVRRTAKTIIASMLTLLLATTIVFYHRLFPQPIVDPIINRDTYVTIIALQPNVPMTIVKTPEETEELLARHLSVSKQKLDETRGQPGSRLVIWPESPMNFAYASDRQFQEIVTRFVVENQTSLLFNSQEPAPVGGVYNSAVLINEKGRAISQYDKIRLMPFGEYVPLPRWLPGASLITGIVGDFTPGANYTLMPVSDYHRAGVFICIESAYPSIARTMTKGGANVLINISNDGYLGPTAVMRQHLANAVFRAVENDRTVVRVTNSGITALIESDGVIRDATKGFETDVRVWRMSEPFGATTFYTRNGDVVPIVCAAITLIAGLCALLLRRKESKNLR
jgi:apolipoprotein N-acyltransferase